MRAALWSLCGLFAVAGCGRSLLWLNDGDGRPCVGCSGDHPPGGDPGGAIGDSESSITHGQDINAGNTGIAAAGLTRDDLTTEPGGTFSTDGAVLERRLFTSNVTLTGTGQVLRDSIIEVPEDQSVSVLQLLGSGTLVERVQIVVLGGGGYICIDIVGGSAHTLRRVDACCCDNIVTTYQDETTIEESFLHDPSSAVAGNALDVIEIYDGDDHLVRLSRLTMLAGQNAPIDVGPWGTGRSVNRLTIEDSFLDGGSNHFFFSNQSSGIANVKVLRNRLGGATDGGDYAACRPPDGDDPIIVSTTAEQASNPNSVLWPLTGPDVNTWAVEQNLTPDRTGEVAD